MRIHSKLSLLPLVCLFLVPTFLFADESGREVSAILKERETSVSVVYVEKEKGRKYPRGYRTHYTLYLKECDKKVTIADGNTSKYMINPNGFQYLGGVGFKEGSADYKERVYSLAYEVLFAVEGKYDAINTYDRGVFSFGFIQNNAKKGELTAYMSYLKNEYYSLYQRYFEHKGILVERDEEGAEEVRVLTKEGVLLRADQAWEYMATDIQVIGCFIAAAHHPEICKSQRLFLHQKYSYNFLYSSFRFKGDSYDWRQFVGNDQRLMAAIITLSVNLGVQGARELFQKAINEVGVLYDLPEEISVDLLLRQVRSIGRDARITKRINLILES
ncbi:hypothetical protein [Algivirga pacifica]|uniref:Uncharacterized protein n=1 Tax=Algivirga pacifica TaxID=1162670 RepID=A0ABP9DKD3_9BACT